MAVYPQVVLTPDPVYLQAESYSAQDVRRSRREATRPGVFGRKHFAITHVSGRTVRAAAGQAYIRGRNVADQGYYRQGTSGTFDVTLDAGDGSNPRIDQIILRVMDNAHDSAGFNECRMEAVPGTPTSGATLANRTGALNLNSLGEASKNWLLLADVLMPAGASTVTPSNIRDRRVFCVPTIPNVQPSGETFLDYMSVPFAIPGAHGMAGYASADMDGIQAAALIDIPRSMGFDTSVLVSSIIWGYRQGATALTGSYGFAIYEANGRKLTEANSNAFTGAANTQQRPTLTLSPNISLDAGTYWLCFGVDTTNAGTIGFIGVNYSGANGLMVPGYNHLLVRTALGAAAATTFVTDMRDGGFTDITLPTLGVPAISLREA